MRRSTPFIALVFAALIAAPAAAQTNQEVADQVIALAKAQWAAEMANASPAEILKDMADEYTEFSAAFPTRLDGKAIQMTLGEAYSQDAGQTLAAEMANPKVQVYGDVAILTYNYIGLARDADGEVNETLAKSTRVYAKQDGSWKLVHANFAPVGNGN